MRVRSVKIASEGEGNDANDAPPRCDDRVFLRVLAWRVRRRDTDAVTMEGAYDVPRTVSFVVDDARADAPFACAGWEACACTMLVGEKCAVATPLGEEYEPAPVSAGEVPENCFVEWEIELVGVERAVRPDGSSSETTRLEYERRMREEANGLFARGEYARALRRYDECEMVLQGALALSTTKEAERRLAKMVAVVACNAANALGKMGRHAESLHRCELALHCDPLSVKAMYRRSIALEALGRDEEALETLREALELSKDKAIREAFVRVRRRVTETNDAERARAHRMMAGIEDVASASIVGTPSIERKDKDVVPASASAGFARFCRRRPLAASAIGLAACAAIVAYLHRRGDSKVETTKNS